ncbi:MULTISPECIES: AraC family transcriptional regulator [unclassified Nodularia (in: cyanobacteria)]|uniref:helix-turn-helix transcriptional regulator n=1 Tax=unclassified Nodularia (in: cyanobacteria) TaxID=2656917 RepID=UPI00188046C6|nr:MULTISPECIES: AraC family transcriptional regulator [unclassified Nodularia (in: cyanobacteria)]MBE9199243.1 helix-turn-helix transcriptional regulator [Nodularia sp. LEGE 06071]MCC2693290.1 helix-turn-helix transcriptional regulator [Nodularia sp. LEGE 04288]
MTKILTDTNWQELKAESEQKGILSIQSKGVETIRQGKILDVCNMYHCWTKLRNGLSIWIHEQEFTDDLVWMRDSFDESQFGLSFFLSGKVRIERHGLTDKTDESIGRYYSECNCDIKETEYWKAGEKFSRIYLEIEPQEFFSSFGYEDLEHIPISLRQALMGDKLQPYYQQGEITQEMWVILSHILQCPYQGYLKQMYLESKAVELITLHCQQFHEEDIHNYRSPVKDLRDVDKIYQAKEILLGNLENPPSLMELARQVGLNDFKLKRGFREVFGTSAFKYLHDYRLEKAKQLLVLGEMKVEEVAFRVGFDSRSYFASAFRKKFGLNPKQYFQHQQKSV